MALSATSSTYLNISRDVDSTTSMGNAVTMLNSSFSEEIPSDMQPGPPLVQFEAVSSWPVTGYLGEEPDPPPALLSGICRE